MLAKRKTGFKSHSKIGFKFTKYFFSDKNSCNYRQTKNLKKKLPSRYLNFETCSKMSKVKNYDKYPFVGSIDIFSGMM